MELKGLVIQNRKEFVEEKFGADAWQKVLTSLSQAERDTLGDMILAAKWYPFELGEHIDRIIVDELGGGKESIFEDIGAKSAQRSLTKMHSTFLTPGDPHAFMKKTEVMYKFYYDTGRREYEQTGPTSGVMKTYDAVTYSVSDCLTVIGYHKEALRMCGARNVRAVEEECRARGGSCCRYRFTWEM